MIVFGLDPGLGSRSATGVAVFRPEGKDFINYSEIWPPKKAPLYEKLKFAREKLERLFTETVVDEDEVVLFACEYFVMRGKGGESLQRLVGAYMSALPQDTDVIEVQNVKVKMALGGSGDSGKEEVGEGVYNWFKTSNVVAANEVRKLIEGGNWDALDALAIGITGYLMFDGMDL